jgi:DNA modification methylase
VVAKYEGKMIEVDGRAILHHGDCLEVLKTLPDCSVDSIVTDPPAGIAFMGKDWDKDKGGRDAWIAWMQEVAGECLRVIKPGGHALVWALPRTSHWTGMAWESAGWEPRDKIVHLFGTGFPKSLNVSKAIDKKDGRLGWQSPNAGQYGGVGGGIASRPGNQHRTEDFEVVLESAEAQQWDGWGTALKPASEDWYCLRKPLKVVPACDTTVVESTILLEALLWSLSPAKLVEHCSASNQSASDEAQYGSARWIAAVVHGLSSLAPSEVTAMFNSQEEARTYWNIALLWQSISEEHSMHASRYTTETESSLTIALKTLNCYLLAIIPNCITQVAYHHCGLWPLAKDVERSLSVYEAHWPHIPQPSAIESVTPRTTSSVVNILVNIAGVTSSSFHLNSEGFVAHPAMPHTEKPASAAEDWWLLRKPIDGTVAGNVLRHGTGALNIDGCRIAAAKRWPANVLHDGSDEVVAGFPDSNGSAARFFYCAKASRRDREEGCEHLVDRTGAEAVDREEGSAGINSPRAGASRTAGKVKNHHPTVKHTELMRYLCRLITPPNGVVLDAFMGSGSTGKAAMLEGFNFIGIEMEAEYLKIAEARISYAATGKTLKANPEPDDTTKDQSAEVASPVQTSLFDA